MSAELLPSGRYPLRRLQTSILLAGVLGLVAIVYSMVKFVRGQAAGEEWILGVGACLLFGAGVASIAHGVLTGQEARLEALEKRAATDANRATAGTPS